MYREYTYNMHIHTKAVNHLRKCLYFSDKEVIEHLEKQRNQSEYITNLIKRDMNRFTEKDRMIINFIIALLKMNNDTS